MKFSIPILAFIVALLLVASQAVYTVDQRKYAIKFQLGEVIETQSNAGLYFKVPLVQNVKYYDKVNQVLDNAEPDRITTSEKKPLLVDCNPDYVPPLLDPHDSRSSPTSFSVQI